MSWVQVFVRNPPVAGAALLVCVAALAMLVALIRGSLPLRRMIAVALLADLACFSIALGLGLVPRLPESPAWDPQHRPFVLGFAILVAYGLARRHAWGYWLALAGGLSSVLLHGQHLVRHFHAHGDADFALVAEAVPFVGAALLIACLAGSRMREHVAGDRGALARLRGATGGLLRTSLVLALASIPYLFWSTLWMTDDHLLQGLCVVAGGLAASGAIFLTRGRTVGVLVLLTASFAAFQLLEWLSWEWGGTAILPAILAGPLAAIAIAAPRLGRLRARLL
jgi:hypothetical protein